MYKYEIGKVYNKQKLINYYKKNGRLVAKVECVDCHKEKEMRASDLFHERTNSCICSLVTHGMNNTRIYSIYANMKDRCYNRKCHAYKNYGARGIKMCDEWIGKNGFLTFYKWAINHGYDDTLTIDRINEKLGYFPDNCQWITKSENTARANKHNVRRRPNGGMYYGISPEGYAYVFKNAQEFARQHPELIANNIRRAARSRGVKKYNGWTFGFTGNKNLYHNDKIKTEPLSTIESEQ